jgi:ketosteroid isomerase-like protein
MDMPPVVQAWFDADRARDEDALIGTFAADAVVRDEGASHSGHDRIRAWWLAAKQKYDHVAEPFEITGNGEMVTVRARVTGNFSGSPATLNSAFRIVDARIAGLSIAG